MPGTPPRRDVMVADDFLLYHQLCHCGATLWMPGVVAQGLAAYDEFVADGLAGEYLSCPECGSRFYAQSGRFERQGAPRR
jgi:hypothetical protein